MDVSHEAPSIKGGRPPSLKSAAHKGDAGRVLVIAGSREMPGAAILCARAALRGGAGLVTLACLDKELLQLVPVAVPETILWDLSGAHSDLTSCDERLIEQVEKGLHKRKFDVIALGPGMGDTHRTEVVLDTVLGTWRGPLLLDADGLNAIAANEELRAKLRARKGTLERRPDLGSGHECFSVLTPHPGEAQRLLGRPFAGDEQSRLQAAAELAKDLSAIVCLKGAGTVTAEGAQAAVNKTGNPGMATAGSGDVLAGLIAALLTQVTSAFTPFAAVRAGAFIHGFAGDLAASELGERAMIASDLVERLGRAEEGAPWGS